MAADGVGDVGAGNSHIGKIPVVQRKQFSLSSPRAEPLFDCHRHVAQNKQQHGVPGK